VTSLFASILLALATQELVEAARAGDRARVEALLSSGANVDEKDEQGSTALMFAALRGDAKMVHALLAANANPNLRDAHGESALLLGAGRGAEVVSALLAAGADPNLADAEGETPLLVAAAGHEESVRLLLEGGADVDHQDQFGVSALTVAEAASASRIAELLQAAGASGNAADRLHAAVRENDQDTVKRLVAGGADVNGLDTDLYETPLMTAVRYRRLDLIVFLLAKGADPSREANGYDNAGENAIELAARENSPWALRAFLEALPPKAHQQDRDRVLLVGCAHPTIVRVALEEGARANTKGERGVTPLACAAAAGALESVTLLLAAGADPTAKAEDGSTALGRAIAVGNQELVEVLKKALER
jgi:ankyrin repeat protein